MYMHVYVDIYPAYLQCTIFPPLKLMTFNQHDDKETWTIISPQVWTPFCSVVLSMKTPLYSWYHHIRVHELVYQILKHQ